MYFKIFKTIVFTVCLILLICQSYHLYKEYKNYETVVTVDISKQKEIEYPGVAICESNHFVNISDHLPSPVQKGLWIRAKQKDATQFYNMFNGSVSADNFHNFFIGDNLTGKDSFGPINDGFIKCVKSTHMNDNYEPCTPINIISSFFTECIGFFNTIQYVDGSSRQISKQKFRIKDNSRNNEMAMIQIKNNHSNDYHSNRIIVLVTAPNTFPLYPIQKLAIRQNQLKFGRRYDITFARTTIKKLPKPYKPYCYEYTDDDDDKSYFDCALQCVHQKMFNKYNCSFSGMDLIWNDKMTDLKLCSRKVIKQLENFDNHLLDKVIYQCKFELCSPDCINEIYNYKVKDVTDLPSFYDEGIDNDTIIIKLLPQDQDEFTYIHQPKISFNDLLSKLGGILSLWVGFSFYSIYARTESIIKKYFAKRVS